MPDIEEMLNTPKNQKPIDKTEYLTPSHFTRQFSDSIDQKNRFFCWLKLLNPSEYPLQQALIRRIQKYHRPTLIEDSIELFLIFLNQ